LNGGSNLNKILSFFKPSGKAAEIHAAFPFLWKLAVVAQVCFAIWMLTPVSLGVGFALIGSVCLWISVLCFLIILCSIFWMAAQPNRDVAVLSPWTILKDKFTSRRPNEDAAVFC